MADRINYGPAHLASLNVFDRFCVDCGFRMSDAAWQRPLKCLKCNLQVRCSNEVPSFWNNCIQCTNNVDCTFRYCRACGCPNQQFNEKKPGQILKKTKAQGAQEYKNHLAAMEKQKHEEVEKQERVEQQNAEKKRAQEEEEARMLREDTDGDVICTEGSLLLGNSSDLNTTGEPEFAE